MFAASNIYMDISSIDETKVFFLIKNFSVDFYWRLMNTHRQKMDAELHVLKKQKCGLENSVLGFANR